MKFPLRVALLLAAAAAPARASFHVMQIEEVVGGIAGDPTAQAIQLRMRQSGQAVLANGSLWAWDKNGANRVLLLSVAAGTPNMGNSALGDRVLFTNSAFNSKMIAGGHAGFVGDFTLANAIPSSYLTAGRITFEDKSGNTTTAGTIYWSLAWGGASYLGSNAGSSVNDADSNFGPAFASALPSGSAKGVALSIAAGTKSSSNANDYAFTGDPATVVKNDRTSFTVVPEPANAALLVLGAAALGAFAYGRRGRVG